MKVEQIVFQMTLAASLPFAFQGIAYADFECNREIYVKAKLMCRNAYNKDDCLIETYPLLRTGNEYDIPARQEALTCVMSGAIGAMNILINEQGGNNNSSQDSDNTPKEPSTVTIKKDKSEGSINGISVPEVEGTIVTQFGMIIPKRDAFCPGIAPPTPDGNCKSVVSMHILVPTEKDPLTGLMTKCPGPFPEYGNLGGGYCLKTK